MEVTYRPIFSSVTSVYNVMPYLYRYEDSNYIDKFFETGELKISCFNEYINYEHENLGDKNEGYSISYGFTENDMTIVAVTMIGKNAGVFCTSTILDKKLLNKFSRNSVFVIKKPLEFMLEVLKSILRVCEVYHGNCIYLESKHYTNNVPALNPGDLNRLTFDDLSRIVNSNFSAEQYFQKDIKYQDQSEYRFVFITDRPFEKYIIIDVPEAIKYCEKVTLN